jgi:adiponectin receptor
MLDYGLGRTSSFELLKKQSSSHLRGALELAQTSVNQQLPIELERWPLQVFLVCAITCFLASSAMHLLWVRCLKTCNVTHNIDLSGISLMIFGSAYGFLYYIFKCESTSYYVYFGLQLFSLLGILVCINCKMFNKEKYQGLKVILFILQGGVALLAVLHWKLMKYLKIYLGLKITF